MVARHTFAFSPHHPREFFWKFLPSQTEGAGNAGRIRRTRSLACKSRKHTSVVTTGSPITPAFPAQWFERLIPRSSRRSGFLVTVPGVKR
jgi:hypothetical protein